MQLKNRKRLATLMAIQDVSQRAMAEAAGWKTHSYVGRLLRGEVCTLEAEPALRIAAFLGVGIDDLFLAALSDDAGQIARHNGPIEAA